MQRVVESTGPIGRVVSARRENLPLIEKYLI